jgi:hypothetical protein
MNRGAAPGQRSENTATIGLSWRKFEIRYRGVLTQAKNETQQYSRAKKYIQKTFKCSAFFKLMPLIVPMTNKIKGIGLIARCAVAHWYDSGMWSAMNRVQNLYAG